MDSVRLAEMLNVIGVEEYNIDGLVVVRHGYLVAEAYMYPFMPGEKHIVYSCTKSVVSALVGIAIDQGHISSVEQPLPQLFPGRTPANSDPRKHAMTLEHVLTMTTGLDCRDSYLYRWQGLHEMERSGDWVQHVLDLPMVDEPGRRFEYCNGASFLLSALLQEKTGLNALNFAQQFLFDPLGIKEVRWLSNPHGVTIGWSDLYMTPRDMAKIGYLYLHRGQWDGRQIVSADWVASSTKKHTAATLEDGYGYQWWVASDDLYMALGYAGQFIFVLPAHDLVVVFVSSLPEQDFYVPQRLLEDYVVSAIRSDKPLADNPTGVRRLQSQIEALAGP